MVFGPAGATCGERMGRVVLGGFFGGTARLEGIVDFGAISRGAVPTFGAAGVAGAPLRCTAVGGTFDRDVGSAWPPGVPGNGPG